jgi:large subunit ribosomal protein L31
MQLVYFSLTKKKRSKVCRNKKKFVPLHPDWRILRTELLFYQIIQKEMKQGIHPENYRPVVFKDMSNGDMFLTKSTAKTNDTVEFEGETYPVVKVEISSSSHPFYTGKSKLVDTAGRVDKFMSRYGKASKK